MTDSNSIPPPKTEPRFKLPEGLMKSRLFRPRVGVAKIVTGYRTKSGRTKPVY